MALKYGEKKRKGKRKKERRKRRWRSAKTQGEVDKNVCLSVPDVLVF